MAHVGTYRILPRIWVTQQALDRIRESAHLGPGSIRGFWGHEVWVYGDAGNSHPELLSGDMVVRGDGTTWVVPEYSIEASGVIRIRGRALNPLAARDQLEWARMVWEALESESAKAHPESEPGDRPAPLAPRNAALPNYEAQ